MNGLKATKIYARFASEVYDDFGEPDYEQEYYRKEHADEVLRKTKHALWMARAERAKAEQWIWKTLSKDNYTDAWRQDALLRKHKWEWVELKCLDKAKEYE